MKRITQDKVDRVVDEIHEELIKVISVPEEAQKRYERSKDEYKMYRQELEENLNILEGVVEELTERLHKKYTTLDTYPPNTPRTNRIIQHTGDIDVLRKPVSPDAVLIVVVRNIRQEIVQDVVIWNLKGDVDRLVERLVEKYKVVVMERLNEELEQRGY